VLNSFTDFTYVHFGWLKAIEKWVFEKKELRDELYLTNQEWIFLGQLADILEVSVFDISGFPKLKHNVSQVFTKVTLYMSRSNTPTLPWASASAQL
jgi:hypothetical protein